MLSIFAASSLMQWHKMIMTIIYEVSCDLAISVDGAALSTRVCEAIADQDPIEADAISTIDGLVA